MVEAPLRPDPSEAFWTFSNFCHKAQILPELARLRIQKRAERVEAEAIQRQTQVERAVRGLAEADREAAARLLLEFSEGVYRQALGMMADVEPQ